MTREQLIKDREALIEALENIEAALLGEIQEFRPDDEQLNTEEAVKTFLMLREARDKAKERHEKRDKAMKAHQGRIEVALGAFMQRSTSQGINTKYGTVFTSLQSTARVADKDAFLSYLWESGDQENGQWQLATISANKAEVAKHLELHDGQLPPGIDYSSRIVVQIRRK